MGWRLSIGIEDLFHLGVRIIFVGDKSHSTRSKEESNKVQTDKVISDQKSKKISN